MTDEQNGADEINYVPEVTTITAEVRQMLKGKRIGAIDFGQKRVGFAVADELHILASPRGVFPNNASLLDDLLRAFDNERLGGIIVGMPVKHDASESSWMREIGAFILHLRASTPLPVYVADEAYSSRDAKQAMIQAGRKKQQRSQKGRTDEVAAAVILREFLRELE